MDDVGVSLILRCTCWCTDELGDSDAVDDVTCVGEVWYCWLMRL